jgi:amidase
MTEIIYRPVRELEQAIRNHSLSCQEIMQAFLERIAAQNPTLNAIVSMTSYENAMRQAERADAQVNAGEPLGALHGLPMAVKDLNDVAGFPTSNGVAAYKHSAPKTRDCLMASRLRAAGAILIGKTNTPEFGVGTLTFNKAFGVTRNPWNTNKHAGGSTGAAAAVSSGMLPFSDGTDSGGSLRYPASFCNLVGLRTSPGTIPYDNKPSAWSPHSVMGTMSRTVDDAALLLQSVSGDAWQSPLRQQPISQSLRALETRPLSSLSIAWSDDLGGLPVDGEILAILASLKERLRQAGALIDDVDFDFSACDEAWQTIEMFGFMTNAPDDVYAHPEWFRDDYVRNVHEGRGLTAEQIAHGFAVRSRMYRDMARLLTQYDVFICPATPVAAPNAADTWVHEIDGCKFDRYFQWQRCATRITMTAHPAIVLPAGFTAEGSPIGFQMLGPYGREDQLLAAAKGIENLLGLTTLTPSEVE